LALGAVAASVGAALADHPREAPSQTQVQT
jgi:hypothetical protein